MPVLVFKSADAYGGAEGDRMRRGRGPAAAGPPAPDGVDAYLDYQRRMRRKQGPAARTPPARGGIDMYFDHRHRMRRPGHFNSWPALLSPSGETLQGCDVFALRKLVW